MPDTAEPLPGSGEPPQEEAPATAEETALSSPSFESLFEGESSEAARSEPDEPGGQDEHPAPGNSEGALPVRQLLLMLVAGLLPMVGLIPCILWAYSEGPASTRQNLAKAMLIVHAAALCLAIMALFLWVLSLAGILRFP